MADRTLSGPPCVSSAGLIAPRFLSTPSPEFEPARLAGCEVQARDHESQRRLAFSISSAACGSTCSVVTPARYRRITIPRMRSASKTSTSTFALICSLKQRGSTPRQAHVGNSLRGLARCFDLNSCGGLGLPSDRKSSLHSRFHQDRTS